MPNGHGGNPKWGGPVVLLMLICALGWLKVSKGALWAGYASYPIAIVFGWRTAWHRYMWDVMEYGGGYTPKKTLDAAKRRFKRAVPLYIAASLLVVNLIWIL